MLFTGKTYDFVKNLVLIWIPAISTFYFSLGAIWGLPAVDEVVKTLAAVAAFLGALVGLSKRSYDNSDEKYDGELVFGVNDDGQPTMQPNFNEFPEDIAAKNELVLKVRSEVGS